MNVREEVEAAAFWDGWVCLSCGHISDEEEAHDEGDECPECGVGSLRSAVEVTQVIDFLERAGACGE